MAFYQDCPEAYKEWESLHNKFITAWQAAASATKNSNERTWYVEECHKLLNEMKSTRQVAVTAWESSRNKLPLMSPYKPRGVIIN